MSRTIRTIHPRQFKYYKEKYRIIKDIEHFGYYHDCMYLSLLYQTTEEYYDDYYNRRIKKVTPLKKAVASGNLELWAKLNGAGPIDLRACKLRTEQEKRTWRQSFKKNVHVVDYEDWDYVKYPRLHAFTRRLY